MKKPAGPDPLRPLEIGANTLIIFTCAFIGAIVLLLPWGSGSLLSNGKGSVCAETGIGQWSDHDPAAGGVAVTLPDDWKQGDPIPPAAPPQLSTEATVRDQPADTSSEASDTLTLCTHHPAIGLTVADELTKVPRFVLLFGFVLLVKRLIRRGRREGLFNPGVARSVQVIGWYILLGTLAVSTLRMLGTALLLRHMAPRDFALATFVESWNVSIGLLIAGAGVITVARVLRQAVALREDVDATI